MKHIKTLYEKIMLRQVRKHIDNPNDYGFGKDDVIAYGIILFILLTLITICLIVVQT